MLQYWPEKVEAVYCSKGKDKNYSLCLPLVDSFSTAVDDTVLHELLPIAVIPDGYGA